ncbi:PBP domain-containing protein [Plasmodiophora brassicae]
MRVAVVLLVVASAVAVHGQDCVITVPPNPLTAEGLATPYTMTGCDQAADTASFAEASIYDPATQTISVYHPLVINAGTQPAAPPVVPSLPANAIVGIWFGSNGDTLTLTGPGLANGNCVNGLPDSLFGQVAYCNAVAFFQAARNVQNVTPLGTGLDEQPCPSTRDFAIVDMDQSDNVDTTYLLTASGQVAQNTAANRRDLPGAKVISNGSDNGLVEYIAGVLQCALFVGNVLEDPGATSPSLALDEIQAARFQQAPVALVPDNDAMVVVNGQPNLQKRNLYRAGVFQDPNASGSPTDYCRNLANIAPTRFQDHFQRFFTTVASPDPATGNQLFNFMCARFQGAFEAAGLDCAGLLGIPSPITVSVDANGVATGCSISAVQV